MKVILKEDIKKLGKMGDIVNVADGYARNYLIPRRMAIEASAKNIKSVEHERSIIQEKARKIKKSLQELADKISNLTLIIRAKAGEEEKLFGSVTTMDIAEALKKEGFDIDKKQVNINEPIKRLGMYSVNIKLHPEIITDIKVQVVQE